MVVKKIHFMVGLCLMKSAIAFADLPPPCPTPDEFKNNKVNSVINRGDVSSPAWSVTSPAFSGGIFTNGIRIDLYDYNLDTPSALTRAQTLQQEVTTVVETKVYHGGDPSNGYFWMCRYDTKDKTVLATGDDFFVLSPWFNPDGTASKTDNTAEKYALVHAYKK